MSAIGKWMHLWGMVAIVAAGGASAANVVPCEQTAVGANGQQQVSCVLDRPATAFRFRANFSGGHDDTKASMTVTVDGTPHRCDDGSKTSLIGEDGDVSLECMISFAKAPPMRRVLGVTLLWYHAEYVDAELREIPD